MTRGISQSLTPSRDIGIGFRELTFDNLQYPVGKIQMAQTPLWPESQLRRLPRETKFRPTRSKRNHRMC